MKKKTKLALFPLIAAIGLTSCQNHTIKVNPNKNHYTVGITQYVRHPALDAATEGFRKQLEFELKKEGRQVSYIETNAHGEPSLCNVNASSLIFRNVDLIMANATAAFQAAINATKTIPILGTSITSYDVAIGRPIDDYVIGGNVSGTSDLAPLDEQANMMFDLINIPDDKKVNIGLLYCSSEPNSIYQIEKISENLKKVAKVKQIDLTLKRYPFVDTNDVDSISRSAASVSDAIYTPTDNLIASAAQTIAAATAKGKNGKRVPIFCGEEGPCRDIGIATLTISYKELGELTGEMAAQVLLGKTDIRKMPTSFSKKFTKKYNKKICQEAGIEIDERFDGYEEIKENK